MSDVEATGSGTDWREPNRRLGGKDSGCLLRPSGARPGGRPRRPGRAKLQRHLFE